ncbi:ceramide phosphoethanolamine synthase-like [Oculina patagonica]
MAGCEESCGFYFVFALVTFFVWMDLSFFDELAEHGSFYNSSMAENMMFPVKSIKLRMQDHTDHYVNLPWMQFFNENTGLHAVPGVTPNLISGIHLFLAILAAKCFISGSLGIRRLGVLLYELRCQLDILDGVVFRAQQNMKGNFMSVWGSMGYLVDAFADMCGGLLVGGACAVFLNRYPPWKRIRTKPHDELESGRKAVCFHNEEEERYVHVSRRSVNIKMLLVIVQIIARSGFWDHYLHSYVELLETPNPDIPRELQAEVLSYRSTWAVMWLWKVSSADAFLQFTILAVLFDKLWVWVQMLNYFGPLELAFVIVFSQLHLMEVRAYLLGT